MPLPPIDDSGLRIQAPWPGTAQAATVAAAHGFLAFGADPVATMADQHLPAGAPEYFRAVPGEAVAAVRAVGDGTLHLSEML